MKPIRVQGKLTKYAPNAGAFWEKPHHPDAQGEIELPPLEREPQRGDWILYKIRLGTGWNKDCVVAILPTPESDEKCSCPYGGEQGWHTKCPIHGKPKEEKMEEPQLYEEVSSVLNGVYNRDVTIADGIDGILAIIAKRPDAKKSKGELPKEISWDAEIPIGAMQHALNQVIHYLRAKEGK